jgi:hypothetical protein
MIAAPKILCVNVVTLRVSLVPQNELDFAVEPMPASGSDIFDAFSDGIALPMLPHDCVNEFPKPLHFFRGKIVRYVPRTNIAVKTQEKPHTKKANFQPKPQAV